MIHLSGFPLTLTQVTAKLTNTDTRAVLVNTSAEPENGTYALANLTSDIDFSAMALGHYYNLLSPGCNATMCQ